jgi:3-hydroxyisobutyrate dehydrogenase-like beta-hydroxyacid dehydrogenase
MLSNPEADESVILGTEGAVSKMKNGALWIDSSTVNPSFSIVEKQQADHMGIQFLDAPVAGTLPHAENAQRSFFVGGPKEAIEKAYPYMMIMVQKVLHIGDSGKGAAYKMLVNMMLAQSRIIFS